MFPKIKLIFLVIGGLLFFFGFGVASLGGFGYILGCIFALLGLYFLSKIVNYKYVPIIPIVFGGCIFAWGMYPYGLDIIKDICSVSAFAIAIPRFIMALVGGLLGFAIIQNDPEN